MLRQYQKWRRTPRPRSALTCEPPIGHGARLRPRGRRRVAPGPSAATAWKRQRYLLQRRLRRVWPNRWCRNLSGSLCCSARWRRVRGRRQIAGSSRPNNRPPRAGRWNASRWRSMNLLKTWAGLLVVGAPAELTGPRPAELNIEPRRHPAGSGLAAPRAGRVTGEPIGPQLANLQPPAAATTVLATIGTAQPFPQIPSQSHSATEDQGFASPSGENTIWRGGAMFDRIVAR